MTIFISIILTAALFLAAVLNLAINNRVRNMLSGFAAVSAAVIGIILYGYSYAYLTGLNAITVIRSLFSVCRMFGGANEFEFVKAAPWFSSPVVVCIFWLGHFLAFYATASAAIATLGGRLLKLLRTEMLRRGDVYVIYGINENSVAYARRILDDGAPTVLFADDSADAALDSAINAMGGLVETGSSALSPDRGFIRHLGLRPGKRRLYAAAMSEDGIANLEWSKKLRSAAEHARLHPAQLSILLRNVEENNAGRLLTDGISGFGSVMAFDEYSLAARMMIKEAPPWRTIKFDDKCAAVENLGTVIIGFARMGRAALDYLIMNGQFYGSTFSADIFDERAEIGSLFGSAVINNYNITFHKADGRSNELYSFLTEKLGAIKYIVVSTGEENENRELAEDLAKWYAGKGSVPHIVQITRRGLMVTTPEGKTVTYRNLYGSDALNIDKSDALAKIINQRYCEGNGLSAQENWNKCDYFSRMSCRASADFSPATLYALNMKVEQLKDSRWTEDRERVENLAKTEHLRWCAFHEVMGYHPMPESVWAERAERWLTEARETGKRPDFAIGKDTERKLHACLIGWDKLDGLSERENAMFDASGLKIAHRDYKFNDITNVEALGSILKMEEAED